MHFVDKTAFADAPLSKLAKRHAEDQALWKAYINAPKGKKTKKPTSCWNQIARPKLVALFQENCGYCGVYTIIGNDGEIDHHLPKAKDLNANHIYDWDNYVWSCPACNRKKGDHYPLLNPCNEKEMISIYFHAVSGCYLLSDTSLQDEYDNTVKNTLMNGKNNPAQRILLVKLLKIQFNKLDKANSLLKLGEEKQSTIDKIKADIKELLAPNNYLFLVEYIIYSFKKKYKNFTYTLEELL